MKAIIVAVLACGVIGCTAEEPDATEPVHWQTPEPGARAAQSIANADNLDVAPAAHGLALAQNCVFIQWCDQPNSTNGTVCLVRPECRNQCVSNVSVAVQNECTADALAVCGRIAQEARIFCQ
jgi:hypothetical protein